MARRRLILEANAYRKVLVLVSRRRKFLDSLRISRRQMPMAYLLYVEVFGGEERRKIAKIYPSCL